MAINFLVSLLKKNWTSSDETSRSLPLPYFGESFVASCRTLSLLQTASYWHETLMVLPWPANTKLSNPTSSVWVAGWSQESKLGLEAAYITCL
eukprot:2954217-Amphidinium_carterae.1